MTFADNTDSRSANGTLPPGHAYKFMIVPAGANREAQPTRIEPTVGKWYAEVEVLEDGEKVYGALGRYEGEGVFTDQTDYGTEEVEMRNADYLQEQLG